jgi:hypothetical protein
LDILLEKLLGMFLAKDDSIRRSESWELPTLPPRFLQYAVLDVVATRLVFEEASKIAPVEHVQITSPGGTRVGILVQEGGELVAYGVIARDQPQSLGSVRVKVPSKSRLVINVETVLKSSAAAILHLLPSQQGKTKSGALTFGQLQEASSSAFFQVVCPLSHLIFDLRDKVLYSLFII